MNGCTTQTIGNVVIRAKTWNPLRGAKDEVFNYIDLSAVDQNFKRIVGVREIANGDAPSRARQIVRYGDVLVSTVRPNLNSVARVPAELDGATASTGFCVLRPINKSIDGTYLFQWVKSSLFINVMVNRATGASYPAVSDRIIFESQIPLPPLDDQIRIAHLLGKIETLIARRKENLLQLDDLLKSVFLEMFGDPIVNPKKFPVRKLSEFYSSQKDGTKCGPFGSALKKEELVKAGVPVWNMDNIDPSGRMILPFRMWITEKKYRQLTSYSVLDGDIVISRAGTVGKMCVAKTDAGHGIISTNLIRLRLGSKLLPLYVVSLMMYCKGRVGRLKTGPDGTFTHMNTGVLDILEFPYPPIALQNQFAAIVEKVEGIKTRYQQNLTELENLYGVVSRKAFKGELDLSRVQG